MNDFDKVMSDIGNDLEKYGIKIKDAVNKLTEKEVKKMVKLTKASAPQRYGKFASAITSKFETNEIGDTIGTWGVRPPHHRLTHLLANGHQKRGGGRVAGNPFIENAYNEVIQEYESGLQKAIDNAKI